MYYVYILKSLKRDRYYIGYSEFPERRLQEHNSGKVKFTNLVDLGLKSTWRNAWTNFCAIRREREIKSMKSEYILKG
jgi:putative endonuclease